MIFIDSLLAEHACCYKGTFMLSYERRERYWKNYKAKCKHLIVTGKREESHPQATLPYRLSYGVSIIGRGLGVDQRALDHRST
jgi:hypothetical protein